MRISDWSSDVCSSDLWQMLKALHGRAVEPLVDHLIKREQAALARTLCVSEGDRRRIHSNRLRAVAIALGAVAARAILGVERRAACRIGRLGGRKRQRLGGPQTARPAPPLLPPRFRPSL